MNFLKQFWLVITRFLRIVKGKLPLLVSYSLLAFSAIVSLMLLMPKWFNRIPAFSYYISERELPMSYELRSEVIIYDQEENQIQTNAQIFVGGYNTQAETGTNFTLIFSSPAVSSIYAIIRFEINGQVFEHTQIFTNDGHTDVFEGTVTIYV